MKLELDDPRKPFRPGDTITGHIVLGSQDGIVQKLHLVLEGRSKTKTIEKHGDSKKTYRARAPLVYRLEQIEISPSLLYENNSKIVPFSLTIPATVPKVDRVPTTKDGFFSSYWNYDWGKPKPNFKQSSGHALPPTFKAGPRGVYKKSTCYIQYGITAVGSRPRPSIAGYQGRTAQPLEPCRFDTKHFWMQSACPLTTSSEPDKTRPIRQATSRINVQSMRLVPEIGAREKGQLTFKEKWRSMTSSSTLPAICFTVALSVPTYVHVGEKLPIALQMKRVELPPAKSGKAAWTQLPFPDVAVASIEIKMKSTTFVRTCGTLGMHTDDWSDTCWMDTQTTGLGGATLPLWAGDAPPAYQPFPLEKMTTASTVDDVGTFPTATTQRSTPSATQTFHLCSGLPLPTRAIPSFETYNVARAYTIRVTIGFSCAGEKRFINYNGPMMVHSQPIPSPSLSASSASALGAGLAAGIAGLSFAPTQDEPDSSDVPAERIDSGIDGLALGGQGLAKPEEDEDWGAYGLADDDELMSQKMAGAAVEGLGTALDIVSTVLSL